jgi:hypothetical protein
MGSGSTTTICYWAFVGVGFVGIFGLPGGLAGLVGRTTSSKRRDIMSGAGGYISVIYSH